MAWLALFRSPSPKVLPPARRISVFALEMLVALSLAFLVWLYLRTRNRESLDHVSIPVQITLESGFEDQYDLEVTGSRHVTVSFIGPSSRIHRLRGMLQRGEVRVNAAISVPPEHRSESRYRDTVRIRGADVPVPHGVTVLVSEGGDRIPVILRRLVERTMRVRLNHPPEERLTNVVARPEKVLVKGPQEILDRTHTIPTIRYYLPSTTGPAQKQERVLTVELPLVQELEGRPVQCVTDRVKFRLTLQPESRIYNLRKVPITFLCPAKFPYRPRFKTNQHSTISLRVKAPATRVRPKVIAFVDLTHGERHAGLNVQPLRLQLPVGCQQAQDPPEPVEFELVPTEIPAEWVVTEQP
jgi:hypothetical protein